MSQTIPTGTTTKVQPRLEPTSQYTAHSFQIRAFKSLAKVVKMDHEVGDSRRVHRTSYGTQRVSATPRRAACHPFCIKFCSWPWRRAVGARVSLPCVCTGSPCVVRPVPVNRHRGEPGHTRDTRSQTNLTTIPTHHAPARDRETTRNQRPTQVRPQPRSRPLPAADSEERPPPANPTQPPPAPPGGAGDTNLTKHLNNHEPHRLTRQTGTGRSSELRKVA